MPDLPVTTWACTNKVGGRPSIAPRACGSPTARRGWCHVVRPSPRRGRHFLPHNEWGFSEGRFGHGPAQGPCAVTPLSVSTAPPACLRRCVPPAAGHFGLGCCCSAPPSAAFATLRSSGGTGDLPMIQLDGGLCRLRLRP